MAEWARKEATRVLLDAFRGWIAAGLTPVPIEKVLECARERPDPVLCDWAIESAQATLARSQAKGEHMNLFGWVVTVLGLRRTRSFNAPAATSIPLWVSARWEPKEREHRKLARAQAAIEVRRLAHAEAAARATPARPAGTALPGAAMPAPAARPSPRAAGGGR